MDEKNYHSFSLPIPHFPIKLLFEADEYDFYKNKQKEKVETCSKNKGVENTLNESEKSSVGSDNGSEIESENERVFMKYLKNIAKKDKIRTQNVSKCSNNGYSNNCNNTARKIGVQDMNSFSMNERRKESSSPVDDSMKKRGQDENEIVTKKTYHLFEKYPDIPIRKELKREWVYHIPAPAFVHKKVCLKDFQEECEKIRRRLRIVDAKMDQSAELEHDTQKEINLTSMEISAPHHLEESQGKMEETEEQEKTQKEIMGNSKIRQKFYNYLIRVLQSGIRSPNVGEIIDHIVYYNCKNWEQKIDFQVLKKVADNSKKEKVLNRTKCFVDWLPKTENNSFSKYEIMSKLKKKTVSKTFKLVCDFNNSLLKGLYINQNLINTFYTEKTKNIFYANSLQNLTTNEIFIISVSFYHPIRGIKIAEYDILSYQTLADLTDAFFCFDSSNYGLPQFDGSVYYIDGILYPDLRSPNALDYSTCILDFYLKKKQTNFVRPPYKIHQDKAIINQIEIPLYQKCCFLHQGNCEHRVIFNNIRQYNRFRDKDFSKYPLRTFKPNIAKKFCFCCHKNVANKIVLDCYLFKENPSYICNSCFELFLVDGKGNTVDAFMKHFDYIDEV
ncbi:snRNA-activating protein complex subunit 3 [Plasmodium gonderi]|uniref:snRNA-activating protein complex subunit 3 n=1 Tax=Plasmodium gonderi TaxID=77519 RepID=A0A1Y1JMN3_PLAGO|nr:snRNA-activating protein complex subunit 3 [Plasmodium gonderi]GAW82477.1 snRNA-activating protein complex subunit 3 [Plasmodium gonderi]